MTPVRLDPNPHATPAEQVRFRGFLSALEEEGLSPTTRACYASDWWNVSESAHQQSGRPFRMDRYCAEDFLEYRANEAARGVSPATLNRRLAFLRRYAAHAGLRSGGLDRVPFQAVVRPASRALAPAEEERLYEAARAAGTATAALVALLLGTGLRASETAALRRGDVEGSADAPRAIRVRGTRRKTVVLPPRAASAMGKLLAEGSGPRSDPVFCEAEGNALSESRLSALVADAAKAAGVEATPRTLRHTFAVRYLQEHRDDVTGLARALGQSGLAQARAYRAEANEGPPKARRIRWNDVPSEELSPVVSRRVLRGARIEVVRYVYRPGATIPVHASPEEQLAFVLQGRIEVRSGRTVLELGPGDVVHLPSGVAHGVRVLGDRTVVTLSMFTPARRASPHVPAS